MALSPCHHSPTQTKLEPVRLLKFTENNFCDKMNTMFTLFSNGILKETLTTYWNYPTAELSMENVSSPSWQAKS